MRPYLAEAALVVVPLRIGGGTRLKILEAGAAGKTVVSTLVGAEGLDFQDGKEIVLADAPEDFANAVLRLLRDTERLRNIGQRARQKVIECYSFGNVLKGVAEAISIVQQISTANAEEQGAVARRPNESCSR
jgi:glycosyltransferase involved in cell wall biosynthesis